MSKGKEDDVFVNVCCAVIAGMFSSAIANPTDVLKVRMQVLGGHRGLFDCFQEVYRYEGVGGLWRVSNNMFIPEYVFITLKYYCKLFIIIFLNKLN